VDAWQKGMAIGGPPAAAAFSAASLARTGALIAGIQAQRIGGGTGGAIAAGGAGMAAMGSGPAPLEVRLSGLRAGELLDGGDVAALLDRLSDEAGDRGLRLMVAA
jgi:hypothetical protein